MKNLEDNSIDLILTDPPYNLGLFMNNRQTNLKKMRENSFYAAGWDDLTNEDWLEHMDCFFSESQRVLKKGGAILMFMSIIKVESLVKLSEKYKFYYKTTGIWHKKNPMPRNMNLHFVNSNECWIYLINNKRTGIFNNEKMELDFIETGITPKNEKKYGTHPTQKPIALLEHFIRLLSNPNDTVLDPFLGSGSTAVACKRLNRNFIGFDLNKDYCELAMKRVEND
ncbi:DNA-methyltransferase [Mannheimia haemolytica]|uniref:DNA-methyltransferase n=1 Tax=Mannheimia haemolytica TaxID=75985 RepID=UPI001CF5526C|nr:site-specific DNA-methyltransferase [Mannheimia haemolytica]MCB4226144.1 site-specific DNA-methyltransferase [Mannheimia haemolytica]